ncbi:binding-protein-dependent transport systems inner membrane component [Lancefieldella parvula DSM 20469]|uniref:Binding-protein-dependent transport systems inner membrane component n=1 Tax=Lancefieldella parvula (strain ATCC 33793 / DSM 20469 / CCUG 32760 / JCM 10300 / KCTC 3663 / VPI 0546 / 1246) TaxID=521095 RepID=C8W7D9_LANP1|nr:ABC transporter permease subunit [Lancefieldella parvula]ACV51379.1 binding-protein-dependent transport systems inner membrane component [Lancefieldella parvula DSM 20469]
MAHNPHIKDSFSDRGSAPTGAASAYFSAEKSGCTSCTQTIRKIISSWGVRLGVLVFWLAIWQIVAVAINQDIVLTSPIQTIQTLFSLAQLREFWVSIGLSLLRIFVGGALAFTAGSLLAFLSFKYKLVKLLFEPLISTIKSIPVASFVILLLIWVRTPYLSISISFLMALPIIYIAVLEGLLGTDQKLIEMANVYQIHGWYRVKAIYLSQLMPSLKTATSLAMGFCWKSGIAAEVIGLPTFSIGEHLYNAKVYLDTPALFAWTLVVIVMSVLGEKIVMWLVSWAATRLEKSCS